MKKYNIAIIGTGMISLSHMNAIRNVENANCIAVADINEEKAKKAAASIGCQHFTDAKEMLEKVPEIDVCIIALPTFLHAKYVKLCAEHKKAVLCEKPIDMTVENAEMIKSGVRESGIIYMTAQVVRFWTGYTIIKEMLEKGEIGDIYMSYFSRCSELQKWDNNWLFDPKTGGGAMFDMLVHDIDYMNYLFGPTKTVYTLATKSDSLGCYNNVAASIEYKNGAKGIAETSFTMQTGYPFTMAARIIGSKATIEFSYSAGFDINQRDAVNSTFRIFRKDKEPQILSLELFDAYTRQLAYFLSCVEKGVQPDRVTIDQSIEVIKTIQAIKKSADSGEVVHF